MNQPTATTTTSTDTHPINSEALRLQLEEDGTFYRRNFVEGRERLLHTLRTNDCHEIIAAAVDGNELANAFAIATNRGHVDVLAALLNHGINVDIKNQNGWTALMYACNYDLDRCVRLLLDHNASVNVQSNIGTTALMIASVCSSKEVVEWLLNHNPDLELKNSNGKTAFDLAKTEEMKEMIRNHVNTSYLLK